MTKIALTLALPSVLFIIGCGATGNRQEIAEDWVDRNQGHLEAQMVDLVVGVDFGYKLGNELIKNAIRDDVTRQVRSGLDWSFETSTRDCSTITATASVELAIYTKAAEAMSSLIRVPALEGTITASLPFKLTIDGDNEIVSWDMFPTGGNVILEITTQ